MYEGKNGFLYKCDDNNGFEKTATRDVWVSKKPVAVTDIEKITNAYTEILKYEAEGLVKVVRYEALSDERKLEIKEILKDLSAAEEENLLEKVMQTPYYKLVESYVKPNGYIGIGMHSADRFQETRLQDGEAAARLLSYYAIPKEAPIIRDFITAMRDDAIVESEFQFYPPAIEQFTTRYDGVKNGTSMMVIFYAMQAMLGYGDDEYVLPFQSTCLESFKEILHANHISDFAKYNEKLIQRYKTPYYVEQDTFVPCAYHLATLAYTNAWRTAECWISHESVRLPVLLKNTARTSFPAVCFVTRKTALSITTTVSLSAITISAKQKMKSLK